MTLKIAFYGQPLLSNNKTGIGYCEDGLLRGLLTLHPQQEYLVDIFTSGEKEKKRQSIRDYGETVKISECCLIYGFSVRNVTSRIFATM